MNESHIIQLDNLNAEYRILKAEYEHLSQRRKRLIKWSLISPLLGIALGAFGMVYFEKPQSQPVVGVDRHIDGAISYANRLTAIDRLADIERRIALLESAKEANTVRAEQRVMDMRTALDKLEKLKAKQDGQLMRVAQDGAAQTREVNTELRRTQQARDAAPLSIQQMANELGVSRLVVK